MMNSVSVPPIGIRHQRHNANRAPERVVQALACEERAMATVVLKDEQPDEQAATGTASNNTRP